MPGLAPGTAAAPLMCQPLPSASSLFTLTVERELEGGRRQRSALRILASLGAAGPCPEPYVPELRLCTGAEPGPLSSTPVVPAVGSGGIRYPEVKQERPGHPNGSPWLGAKGLLPPLRDVGLLPAWLTHPWALVGQGSACPGVWVPAPPLSRGFSHPTSRTPTTSHPLADTSCLPWIIERLLEGNSLTFLLLCVTLPGSPWDWDAALGCPFPEVHPHPAPHLALGP